MRSLFSRLFNFSAMILVLLVAGIFVCCLNRNILADPDIWWHLRNAEYLLGHHAFLRQEIYSSTIYGKPWPNSEWLSELPYLLAWKWFGIRGIYVLAVAMIEILALGVWALAWQYTRNAKSALLASCLFIFMESVSLAPRTQMFGWLCLIAELMILEGYRRGKDRVWLLPVVFTAWINLHGSWPIGILFFGIYVSCGFFRGSWGCIETTPWTASQRKKLLLLFALSVAALMLNPYGWRLIVFPVQITFHHQLTINTILEWQTLNFHEFRGKLLFTLLAALTLLSLTRKRIWNLSELLPLLIATLAAFTYSRFLLLEGIVFAPIFARELNIFSGYKAEADKPLLNCAIMAIAAAFVCTHIPSEQQLWHQANEGYPSQAVQFMRSNPVQGMLFNDYDWGGYLIWNLPKTKVFIDSNAEAFDQWGVFSDYMDTIHITHSLEILDKYQIEYVLLAKSQPLIYLLKHNAGWTTRYEDGTAVLLQRAGKPPIHVSHSSTPAPRAQELSPSNSSGA